MINTFRKVFQVSCCLCNKKANLYRNYGVLERKEKGKTGGVEGLERVTTHFGSFVSIEKLCCDTVSLALGRNRVFRVAIGILG